LRGGRIQRLAHVLQAASIAKAVPGSAPEAEGASWRGEAELGGQGEGPVGVPDGFAMVPPDHLCPGLVG
jgi:hypothetical protein